MTAEPKLRSVTLPSDGIENPGIAETTLITDAQLKQDIDYHKALIISRELLDRGLISLVEFNKLCEINRQTFSPLWAAIMPKKP